MKALRVLAAFVLLCAMALPAAADARFVRDDTIPLPAITPSRAVVTPAPTQKPSEGQSATKAPSQPSKTAAPTAAPTAEPSEAPEATAEPTAVPTEQPTTPQSETKAPENVAVTPQSEGKTPQGETTEGQAPQPAQPNRFPVAAVIAIGIGAAAVIAAIVLLFVRRRK